MKLSFAEILFGLGFLKMSVAGFGEDISESDSFMKPPIKAHTPVLAAWSQWSWGGGVTMIHIPGKAGQACELSAVTEETARASRWHLPAP